MSLDSHQPSQTISTKAPLDISELARAGHSYDLRVINEAPEDASARREAEAEERKARLRRQDVLFYSGLACLIVVFGVCAFGVVAWAGDDRKWATTLMASIVSGILAFVAGQATKK
jgi:hypothetical protein